MLRIFRTLLLIIPSLVVLCSCGGKDKEGTIFGSIPSIYETEIMTIVKDAHALYPNEENYNSLDEKVFKPYTRYRDRGFCIRAVCP